MQTTVLALAGLASVLFGWILLFVLPGSPLYAWIVLAIGAAMIAGATAWDFRRVRKALTARRGRFGVGTALVVSLFAGVVVLGNAINVRFYHRFDFTGLAQFTLTSQTRQVLSDLREEVEVVSLFAPMISATLSGYARDLLAEYRAGTDRLTFKEIDPDIQPDQARLYGLDRSGALLGAVIFRGAMGQRQVLGPQIAAEAEHAFTSAILEVTGIRQKRVYFLTGHGEQSIQQGYRSAWKGLRDNLFQVEEVDLAATQHVPPDAAAIVVAGPRGSLSGNELDLITAYLESEGRLLLLLDPDPPEGYRDLASSWWIEIEDGEVVDPTSYVAPHRTSPLVPRTRNGFQLGDSFFPGATAILPREGRPPTIQLEPLVWTSDEAWLEKNNGPDAQARFDPSVDRGGPLAIGVLLAETSADETDALRGTRIAVIGDSDFASDRNFANEGNSSLFLTAVSWLTAGEKVISIDRKVFATRRLLLNPEQARFLHISSMGLLPLSLLVVGVYVWWRRSRM